MSIKAVVQQGCFNHSLKLPYNLRLKDFEMAMQDVYDFFSDTNAFMVAKGLPRLDDMLRPANMSGTISDMLTDSLAKHSRSLTKNTHFNGHPDLVLKGEYPGDGVKAGEKGIEVKSTRKKGAAVDTHGGRDQTMCVFVYSVDNATEPAKDRAPLEFTEVYLGDVVVSDFRRNERSDLGTRTSTLDKEGIKKLRANWVYKINQG